MGVTLPDRLSLAQRPTPLQPLDRLSAYLGGPRIWLKRDDLTGCALSGNKVRKLEFTLAAARAAGAQMLITSGGVQSNHCRAVAVLGAQLGLHVHLILRGELDGAADGNLLLDQLCGARISVYPQARYQRELPALFAHWAEQYRAQGLEPWSIPTGASDGHGVWGYVAAAQELAADCAAQGIAPRYLFHATGSGGTQAGLSVGALLADLPCQVIGLAVCDDAGYFQRKVRADLDDWQRLYGLDVDPAQVPVTVDARWIGPGYGVATAEVWANIALVARLEGVVLDPVYTGKAMHGLISSIRAGEYRDSDDLVFVHTGGIFGLFPQRAAATAALGAMDNLAGH